MYWDECGMMGCMKQEGAGVNVKGRAENGNAVLASAGTKSGRWRLGEPGPSGAPK